MGAAPALLIASAGVGIGHAVLPDHWLALAAVGQRAGHSRKRVAKLGALAAGAHLATSLVLGAAVVVVGVQLRGLVGPAQRWLVGGLLMATGLWLLRAELRHNGHHHHHHHHHHPEPRAGGRLALVAAFGAAASPDLSILPVFLAAAATGTAVAVGCLAVFAAATVGTIVGLTVAAHSLGGLGGAAAERFGGGVSAAVLLVVGGLVVGGVV